MTAWKWYERVALQKVEHAYAEQICDNTDMIAEIKGVPQMYAFVSVVSVV